MRQISIQLAELRGSAGNSFRTAKEAKMTCLYIDFCAAAYYSVSVIMRTGDGCFEGERDAVLAIGKKQIGSDAILRGSCLSTLLRFAVPIVMGNFLQHLYSLVDAIVVGRFLGDLPLAGISVAAPMMDILMALIIGGTIGVGVLVGQQVGAGDWMGLTSTLSTTLLGGLSITVVLSILGIVLGRPILLAQGTQESVCDEAMVYLFIVFVGMIFSFLYNYYATILRSYGNSRVPFFVLLLSAVLNIALDMLLVGVLHTGIWGVAVATVLCQIVSAGCCCLYIYKKCPRLCLRKGQWRFSISAGRTILSYAWAGALQQAVVCIGRFIIQGMLNGLGTDTVTGYNMGMRTEQFLFCFSQGISASMVVCLSQNKGAGNPRRMQKFYRCGILCELILAILLGTVCACWPRQLISVFSSNPDVIVAGSLYIGTMAWFYIAAFLGEICQSFFRGIGRLQVTMVASLGQVALRVFLSWLLIPVMGVRGICLSIIVGWGLLVLIEGGISLHIAKRLCP